MGGGEEVPSLQAENDLGVGGAVRVEMDAVAFTCVCVREGGGGVSGSVATENAFVGCARHTKALSPEKPNEGVTLSHFSLARPLKPSAGASSKKS